MLGKIFKVSLLLINAIAVLSEDRFLARRMCPPSALYHLCFLTYFVLVGWVSSAQPQSVNASFHPTYDQNGYGAVQGDAGLKARLIDLISAVRTLMRSA
jgi:hypothetical protein